MINFAEFQLDSLCLHLRLTVHLSVFSAGKSLGYRVLMRKL